MPAGKAFRNLFSLEHRFWRKQVRKLAREKGIQVGLRDLLRMDTEELRDIARKLRETPEGFFEHIDQVKEFDLDKYREIKGILGVDKLEKEHYNMLANNPDLLEAVERLGLSGSDAIKALNKYGVQLSSIYETFRSHPIGNPMSRYFAEALSRVQALIKAGIEHNRIINELNKLAIEKKERDSDREKLSAIEKELSAIEKRERERAEMEELARKLRNMVNELVKHDHSGYVIGNRELHQYHYMATNAHLHGREELEKAIEDLEKRRILADIVKIAREHDERELYHPERGRIILEPGITYEAFKDLDKGTLEELKKLYERMAEFYEDLGNLKGKAYGIMKEGGRIYHLEHTLTGLVKAVKEEHGGDVEDFLRAHKENFVEQKELHDFINKALERAYEVKVKEIGKRPTVRELPKIQLGEKDFQEIHKDIIKAIAGIEGELNLDNEKVKEILKTRIHRGLLDEESIKELAELLKDRLDNEEQVKSYIKSYLIKQLKEHLGPIEMISPERTEGSKEEREIGKELEEELKKTWSELSRFLKEKRKKG